jgi:anti-anti-sigma factor
MEISSTTEGGITTFSLVGRIDFATSTHLERAATAAIKGGNHRVVLDMREVNYISSAGLRAILVAAKQAKSAGGGVAVFGLQPRVEDVFTTSGFGRVVPVTATEAQARETLNA